MAIELATKYLPYVDEVMKEASMISLITNNDFEFTGAKKIKVYKMGTAPMQDYGRNSVKDGNWSHYGEVTTLDANTEEFELTKDRSFTFEIDALDEDETAGALKAAEALNRQIREEVIPEVDINAYQKIVAGAGTTKTEELTADNIYDMLIDASAVLDDFEVPQTNRYILATPTTVKLMKKNEFITMNEDIGEEMRTKGVIAMIDGALLIKVPANRLPENFGFLYGHPCAAMAPTKLADYKIHQDPPGLSGDLVEGRINYDAFVKENKVNALYCHMTGAST